MAPIALSSLPHPLITGPTTHRSPWPLLTTDSLSVCRDHRRITPGAAIGLFFSHTGVQARGVIRDGKLGPSKVWEGRGFRPVTEMWRYPE